MKSFAPGFTNIWTGCRDVSSRLPRPFTKNSANGLTKIRRKTKSQSKSSPANSRNKVADEKWTARFFNRKSQSAEGEENSEGNCITTKTQRTRRYGNGK